MEEVAALEKELVLLKSRLAKIKQATAKKSTYLLSPKVRELFRKALRQSQRCRTLMLSIQPRLNMWPLPGAPASRIPKDQQEKAARVTNWASRTADQLEKIQSRILHEDEDRMKEFAEYLDNARIAASALSRDLSQMRMSSRIVVLPSSMEDAEMYEEALEELDSTIHLDDDEESQLVSSIEKIRL